MSTQAFLVLYTRLVLCLSNVRSQDYRLQLLTTLCLDFQLCLAQPTLLPLPQEQFEETMPLYVQREAMRHLPTPSIPHLPPPFPSPCPKPTLPNSIPLPYNQSFLPRGPKHANATSSTPSRPILFHYPIIPHLPPHPSVPSKSTSPPNYPPSNPPLKSDPIDT